MFTSLRGPEEVIKELLGSTVTTDHGIMQRLLPVTWTDTNVRPYGRTAPELRPLLAMSESPEVCQFSSTEAISQHCYNVSASN